jgi:hypothetical protein
MKNFKWVILISSVLLVQCSSSNIVSRWQSSESLSPQTGRIVVVGLIRESDKLLQQKMENHLANDLCNLGYDAVPFLELYGSETPEGPDENQVMKQLKQDGTAAVITIVLLKKERDKYHIPKSMFETTERYNSDFDLYYRAIYSKIYEEGYYVDDTNYFWESNLFTLPDQKLIYSVKTQSFNPAGTASLAHEYGKLIIGDMLEQHIIKNLHAKK